MPAIRRTYILSIGAEQKQCLAKRAPRDMENDSENQGKSRDSNQASHEGGKKKGKKPNKPIMKSPIDGVQFADMRTPIPKGSTVKKLSLLFADANIFYHKFQSFINGSGGITKEHPSLEDGLNTMTISWGDISVKGRYTNPKLVVNTSTRLESLRSRCSLSS